MVLAMIGTFSLAAKTVVNKKNTPVKKAVKETSKPEKNLSQTTTQSIVTTQKKAEVQKKLPRLVDLGADKCIPCKMMAPILEDLKKEYKGKIEVEFIDVWKNNEKGQEYGVRAIPTQIFYDATGKEVFRHEGYFPKEDIIKTFFEKGMLKK
jgi:thioredoxin 1